VAVITEREGRELHAAKKMKKVLACIDFSQMERPVIEAAAGLAGAFAGRISRGCTSPAREAVPRPCAPPVTR